jgi:S1-C subfamily serine protease
MANVKPIIVLAQENWTQIEALAHHAVVQVCSECIGFNWEQPYIHGDQSENRGSGFFIDAEGYIITTAHTVENARLIWIKMPLFGAKPLFADVVGICPERDVALLKLRPEILESMGEYATKLPHLMMGNSDAVNHTDKILVLGYPMGQNNIKSSTGVISGRESGIGRTFFQITAPVNPGSSGGPVFNEQGHVIGITVSMMINAQNIGYAIPINDIAMVLADLYKIKLVRTGILGVRFNACDDSQALFLGNPVPSGLYINTVFTNSILGKAGVQEGDMLYDFNEFRLDGSGHTIVPWTIDRVSIHDLVARLTPGQKVSLNLYRKGQKKSIEFVFEIAPPSAIRWLYPLHEHIDYEIFGGMIFMHLADNHINEFVDELPELSEYLKMENRWKSCLIITHVIPGSYAYQIGSLRRGQIIKEINGNAVSTLEQLRKELPKSLETGFLTLSTTDNTFVVFSFKNLLKFEKRLVQDFKYPLSPTLSKLIQKNE